MAAKPELSLLWGLSSAQEDFLLFWYHDLYSFLTKGIQEPTVRAGKGTYGFEFHQSKKCLEPGLYGHVFQVQGMCAKGRQYYHNVFECERAPGCFAEINAFHVN